MCTCVQALKYKQRTQILNALLWLKSDTSTNRGETDCFPTPVVVFFFFFQLWIFAKDKGLPFVQTSQSQRVTIIINDTNDNSPKFNESEKQFEVYENLSNVTVGNVLAFDSDIDARTLYRLGR